MPYSPDRADTIAMLFYRTPRLSSEMKRNIQSNERHDDLSPIPRSTYGIASEEEKGHYLY